MSLNLEKYKQAINHSNYNREQEISAHKAGSNRWGFYERKMSDYEAFLAPVLSPDIKALVKKHGSQIRILDAFGDGNVIRDMMSLYDAIAGGIAFTLADLRDDGQQLSDKENNMFLVESNAWLGSSWRRLEKLAKQKLGSLDFDIIFCLPLGGWHIRRDTIENPTVRMVSQIVNRLWRLTTIGGDLLISFPLTDNDLYNTQFDCWFQLLELELNQIKTFATDREKVKRRGDWRRLMHIQRCKSDPLQLPKHN